MRTLRLLPASLALLTLFGCGNHDQAFYQGYVEGDYVYVASSEPGRLDTLAVRRGQQVDANQPLYTLDATREAAARDQAQAELSAARAQLEESGPPKSTSAWRNWRRRRRPAGGPPRSLPATMRSSASAASRVRSWTIAASRRSRTRRACANCRRKSR